MKVRIGNDIRLDIQLALGENQLNIQYVKAILVNTTLRENIQKEYKNKNRFIGRFPIEPYLNEFEPSAYRICSTGNPKYYAIVANQYKGFGLHPQWKNKLPLRQEPYFEYTAEVYSTPEPNVITVYFPAEAQLYEGKYELILITKVYDPGYKNNQRTFTLNKKNIFELVSSSDESDYQNGATISVDLDSGFSREDIYVTSGVYSGDRILLSRNDGGSINIDMEELSWYEQ